MIAQTGRVFNFDHYGIVKWDGNRGFEHFSANGPQIRRWTHPDPIPDASTAWGIVDHWLRTGGDLEQVEPMKRSDLEMVLGDLRGDHPWIPGMYFRAIPELQVTLIEFLESLLKDSK